MLKSIQIGHIIDVMCFLGSKNRVYKYNLDDIFIILVVYFMRLSQ
jgi:hypothetical protein